MWVRCTHMISMEYGLGRWLQSDGLYRFTVDQLTDAGREVGLPVLALVEGRVETDALLLAVEAPHPDKLALVLLADEAAGTTIPLACRYGASSSSKYLTQAARWLAWVRSIRNSKSIARRSRSLRLTYKEKAHG